MAEAFGLSANSVRVYSWGDTKWSVWKNDGNVMLNEENNDKHQVK